MKRALEDEAIDESKLEKALAKWDPIIDIPFLQEDVKETINDFACVVDKIETGVYQAPPLDKLKKRMPKSKKRFGTNVCGNCDARFFLRLLQAICREN